MTSNFVINIRRYRPMVAGTILIIIGAFLIAVFPSGTPYEIAHQSALIMGVTIFIVSLLEFRKSPRNIIRIDLLMFVALYGLTLMEFLYSQPDFNHLVRVENLETVMTLIAIGFVGIAIGRHWHFRAIWQTGSQSVYLSPRAMFIMLLLFTFSGYFYMLMSVDFNPVKLVEAMIGPRFSQPWGRGRYGGLKDLLYEIGLLIYLVPAMTGVILAQRQSFTRRQILVTQLIFLFTLFHGFSSGTRNIFVVYVITFVCSYIMVRPNLSKGKVIQLGIIFTIILLVSTQVILEFRREGLARYINRTVLQNEQYLQGEVESVQRGLFIDYNLLTLSKTVDFFPNRADYLGLEVPIWALIKPVPRAFWPGKPKGLSISIESVRSQRGAGAATWSATFLGESYMGGGMFGAAIAALFFGILAAWWNKRFIPTADMYQNLLYASGIFAALISMRSLFWLTTAILPTIALAVYAQWFHRRRNRMHVTEIKPRTQHSG